MKILRRGFRPELAEVLIPKAAKVPAEVEPDRVATSPAPLNGTREELPERALRRKEGAGTP